MEIGPGLRRCLPAREETSREGDAGHAGKFQKIGLLQGGLPWWNCS